MAKRSAVGAIALATLLTIDSQARCTTIVFRRDHSRILVAADRRGTTNFTRGKLHTSHEVSDTFTKILILGKIGFAATGSINYIKDPMVSDSLGDWNSFDDAKAAFSVYGDSDVDRLADAWASLAVAHYSGFYRVAKLAEFF